MHAKVAVVRVGWIEVPGEKGRVQRQQRDNPMEKRQLLVKVTQLHVKPKQKPPPAMHCAAAGFCVLNDSRQRHVHLQRRWW